MKQCRWIFLPIILSSIFGCSKIKSWVVPSAHKQVETALLSGDEASCYLGTEKWHVLDGKSKEQLIASFLAHFERGYAFVEALQPRGKKAPNIKPADCLYQFIGDIGAEATAFIPYLMKEEFFKSARSSSVSRILNNTLPSRPHQIVLLKPYFQSDNQKDQHTATMSLRAMPQKGLDFVVGLFKEQIQTTNIPSSHPLVRSVKTMAGKWKIEINASFIDLIKDPKLDEKVRRDIVYSLKNLRRRKKLPIELMEFLARQDNHELKGFTDPLRHSSSPRSSEEIQAMLSLLEKEIADLGSIQQAENRNQVRKIKESLSRMATKRYANYSENEIKRISFLHQKLLQKMKLEGASKKGLYRQLQENVSRVPYSNYSGSFLIKNANSTEEKIQVLQTLHKYKQESKEVFALTLGFLESLSVEDRERATVKIFKSSRLEEFPSNLLENLIETTTGAGVSQSQRLVRTFSRSSEQMVPYLNKKLSSQLGRLHHAVLLASIERNSVTRDRLLKYLGRERQCSKPFANGFVLVGRKIKNPESNNDFKRAYKTFALCEYRQIRQSYEFEKLAREFRVFHAIVKRTALSRMPKDKKAYFQRLSKFKPKK